MSKVHKHDHGDEDPPKNPEPHLDNYHTKHSYPMPYSDIEDLIDSHGGYSAEMAFSCHISRHSASSFGYLVDMGDNGCLAGADIHILERTGRKVSVTGINDHELRFRYSFLCCPHPDQSW